MNIPFSKYANFVYDMNKFNQDYKLFKVLVNQYTFKILTQKRNNNRGTQYAWSEWFRKDLYFYTALFHHGDIKFLYSDEQKHYFLIGAEIIPINETVFDVLFARGLPTTEKHMRTWISWVGFISKKV